MNQVATANNTETINYGNTIRLLEYFVFVASIAACIALLSRASYVMSTTSLWGDEYANIIDFTQKGLFHVLTDYSVPRNHIFYNIINSFWPNSISLSPIPARFSSILFTYIAFFCLFYFAYRVRAYAAGALVFLALSTNPANFDLLMQARGYGLVFLCAVLQCMFSYFYLQGQKTGWLLAAALAGMIGTMTIPIYLIFTGVLFIALFVSNPRKEIIYTSLAAALLGALFYFPTISQIIHNASRYADRWGSQYDNFQAVLHTAAYFFPKGDSGFYVLVMACLLLSCAVTYGSNESRNTVVSVYLSVGLFIAACLLIETPAIRTTQFTAGAISVAFVLSYASLSSLQRDSRIVTALALILCLPLFYSSVHQLRSDPLRPIASFLTSAKAADFVRPDASSIVINGHPTVYPTYLIPLFSAYLEQPDKIVSSFDSAEFADGGQVYIDGNRNAEMFRGTAHEPLAIDLHFPMRGGHQVVSFVPRKTGAIEAVSVKGDKDDTALHIIDSKSKTPWLSKERQSELTKPTRLVFDLDQDKFCDRFFFFVGSNIENRPDHVRVYDFRAGQQSRVDAKSIRWVAGLLVVDFQETPDSIMVKLFPAAKNRPYAVYEAWCEAAVSS